VRDDEEVLLAEARVALPAGASELLLGRTSSSAAASVGRGVAAAVALLRYQRGTVSVIVVSALVGIAARAV
jgi:hypothetical protein